MLKKPKIFDFQWGYFLQVKKFSQKLLSERKAFPQN